MVEKTPYREIPVSSGKTDVVIRRFDEETKTEELKWHWDEEKRIIYPLHETDWQIQLDNQLPRNIDSEITIQKGEWHRLIKGSGSLEVMIEKIKDI